MFSDGCAKTEEYKNVCEADQSMSQMDLYPSYWAKLIFGL